MTRHAIALRRSWPAVAEITHGARMAVDNHAKNRCNGYLPMAYQTFECEREGHHHGPHACMGHMHKTTDQLDLIGERIHLSYDYAITWTALDVASFRTGDERFPAEKIAAYANGLNEVKA